VTKLALRVTAGVAPRDGRGRTRDDGARRVTILATRVTVGGRSLDIGQKKPAPFGAGGVFAPCFYCGGKTAKASTSTSQSATTRAVTPTVDRAGFTGLVGLLKNWLYAAFQPCESMVPPFSLSGTR